MSTATVQTINQPDLEPRKENPHEIVNGVHVEGNVVGNIVNGNNNIIYSPNSTYGDVIKNYYESVEPHQRAMKPQAPYKPRNFVGREPELEMLEEHIKSGEAVLVYGQNGLGKTTLTKFAANGAAAQSMNDGVLLVEGIDEDDGSFLGFKDIVQQFFNALFESVPTLQVDIPTARTYLSNTTPLVILDHYQISETSLTRLRDLFPNGSIIATSEIAIYNDAFDPVEVSPLNREESISLLSSKSGIENNTSHSTEFNEICNLLADVPLGIIKTANIIRSKKLSLRVVADQLKKIRQPSTDPIQAAIERSFGLIFLFLNENERDMLVQAATAPGFSVDREWLDSLTDGKAASKSLEDMELLQANSPRLRMAEGLRRVVLSNTKYVAESRESLLQYILKQLESKSLDFEYVSGELGNILGLLRWTFDEKRWEDVLALGRAVDTYLTLNGLWDARESVLKLVEEAARNLEASNLQSGQTARAWALHQLGSLEAGLGSREAAYDILKQALDLRKSLNDKEGAAFTQHNMWVLFPPISPIDRLVDAGQKVLGRILKAGIFPWIILVLIGLLLWRFIDTPNLLWKTYRNENIGFELRYPNNVDFVELNPDGPKIGRINFPPNPKESYYKELIVVTYQEQREIPCDIPIDSESWAVDNVVLENIQFLRALNKLVDRRQKGYAVYATPKNSEPETWLCLIFSYTPNEQSSVQHTPTSSDSEIALFEKIVYTFRWLPLPTPTETFTGTPPTITITATDTPTITITPSETPTPTNTYTPTMTDTPSNTPTFTPTATNTPCIYPYNWYVYTVQRGDTLFGISQWYEISWQELAKANCKTTNVIIAGERLYVPNPPPYGSITGYLFADLNKNGIQDGNETRLSNVRVTLKDVNGNDIKTFDTNDNGEFKFQDLVYGAYYILDAQFILKPAQTILYPFPLVPDPRE